MAASTGNRAGSRRHWWRFFVQFSLRSLLIAVTVASVLCWWFLRPKVREEYVGLSGLKVIRQVKLVKVNTRKPIAVPSAAIDMNVWVGSGPIEQMNGQFFLITNVGRWQAFNCDGGLLVDGHFHNGVEHGRWTTFHPNGRKAVEGYLREGVKVGVWRTWDEEGRMMSEVAYEAEAIATPGQ